jgi:hypothetical protein
MFTGDQQADCRLPGRDVRITALGFDADLVVNRGSDSLLAAEVSLGGLNRDVAE